MCSFAAKWKAVNDTANPQNEDGTDKVKKKNTNETRNIERNTCILHLSVQQQNSILNKYTPGFSPVEITGELIIYTIGGLIHIRSRHNTFILWLVSTTECSFYQSISSLTMRADICWCILEAVIPFADVGITTIWPTLLRVVNNRACLYKICLYYNWSKY